MGTISHASVLEEEECEDPSRTDPSLWPRSPVASVRAENGVRGLQHNGVPEQWSSVRMIEAIHRGDPELLGTRRDWVNIADESGYCWAVHDA